MSPVTLVGLVLVLLTLAPFGQTVRAEPPAQAPAAPAESATDVGRNATALDPKAGKEGTEDGSEGIAVTLRWKARQEKQIYGYLVYRSEQRSGPFLRASRHIVRAEGGSDETVNSYHWVDREVEAGKRYYYYLDVVASTGVKSRFSGVVSKVAGGDSGPPGGG
ncbi:MAG: hypothetical protein AAGN66_01895 [Acidobacteriota bacterium]